MTWFASRCARMWRAPWAWWRHEERSSLRGSSRRPNGVAGEPSPPGAQTTDPLAMSRLLLDGSIDAVLVGGSDPPAADERAAIGELAALVAAIAGRRPERLIVLAGGMAERLVELGDPANGQAETLWPLARDRCGGHRPSGTAARLGGSIRRCAPGPRNRSGDAGRGHGPARRADRNRLRRGRAGVRQRTPGRRTRLRRCGSMSFHWAGSRRRRARRRLR